MTKVKSFLLKTKLKGFGIVNYDSNQQKWAYNQLENKEKVSHDNVNFAKKNWHEYTTKDGEKKLGYKLKISSDCLRHEIFIDDFEYQTPNLMHHAHILIASIASPASLIRGYLYTVKDVLNIKRTSALTITDASQTCNAVSMIETFSRSGVKTTDDNKADTTFFKKETVGDIEYEALGSIDLKELQFISLDKLFDRLAVESDWFTLYKELLQSKLPSFNGEPKYYQIKNSCVEIPELGVVLSNEDVVKLTKELIARLLKISIRRAKAYAKLTELYIKPVYDVLKDTAEDERGWIKIHSLEDVENINFDMQVFYEEEDTEKAELLRKDLGALMEKVKEKNKAEKEKLSEEKKKKTKARKEILDGQ